MAGLLVARASGAAFLPPVKGPRIKAIVKERRWASLLLLLL
jgi:hypothetical protein